MILKKLMHFLCGRSLEKEVAKTNALIREAEQHEKAAMERLKAQADDYRSQVALYKEARDSEFKEFVAFMNEQLDLAESYVPHLGDFQDKMFVCFESWMNTSVAEQRIQLLIKQITGKRQMLDFITVLQVELGRLTQRKERDEWRHMIKERPIQVRATLIKHYENQVDKNQKSSSASIRDDLMRLKSHSVTLRKEIKELCNERDQLVASSKEVMNKHKGLKSELNHQYRTCIELFSQINNRLSDHFGAATTGNSLADEFISIIEGPVTLPKLFSIHKVTADVQTKAQDEFNSLSDDFQSVRARIAASRLNGDFATFNEDKAKRDSLYHECHTAREKLREIRAARRVIRERIDEIKKMLAKFDSLHPDESIRRIVDVFCMDKGFNVHHAIGVSTRGDRRKHHELKIQRI